MFSICQIGSKALRSEVAAGINGKVMVIGGDDHDTNFSTNEEYDPVLDTWRTRTPMPTVRNGIGVGIINNTIYVIGGGAYSDFLTVNEVYTPEQTYYVFTKNP